MRRNMGQEFPVIPKSIKRSSKVNDRITPFIFDDFVISFRIGSVELVVFVLSMSIGAFDIGIGSEVLCGDN